MKKYITALLMVGLSASAFAAQTVPITTTDKQLITPQFAGVSTCVYQASTGTLCAVGSGIILDIIASSVATTDNVVIRDSNTENTTSTVLFSISSAQLNAPHIFPRFKNGLAVTVEPASGGIAANAYPAWTIVYTKDLY